MGFQDFFRLSISGSTALLPDLSPPPEGGGDVVFGDGFGDPSHHLVETLLGQFEACQLLFHFRNVKEVHLGKNRRTGDLLDQPDGLGGEKSLYYGGGG